MAQTNSSTSLLSSFSFGTCAPTQDFPTLSCLPALWLAFFAACVFAALGFGVILVMKLRRCYQLSRGRKDVYFNEVEFLAPQVLRGGCVGAGTSSMLRGTSGWILSRGRCCIVRIQGRRLLLERGRGGIWWLWGERVGGRGWRRQRGLREMIVRLLLRRTGTGDWVCPSQVGCFRVAGRSVIAA